MEKIVEETACLEVCNQIHEIDALRDNLVEEADAQERGNEPYIDEQPSYFPVPEPVGHLPKNSNILHHYYLIELEQIFVYDIPVRDIVLVLRNKLEAELGSLHFDLHVDRGRLTVNLKYVGEINLTTDQVLLCRRFQKTLLRVLIDHDLKSLNEHMDGDILEIETEYLLLPATAKHQRPVIIDWPCVNSVLFSCKKNGESPLNCSLAEGRARIVQTKDGPVCTSLLQNSLVYTPHTDQMYCTTGILELNANSRRGKINSYKKYYEERHGIKLCFEHESLVRGRPIFRVKNYLQRCRNQIEKESSMPSVELPPELCSIVMSPISINTFYSFSFVPSIMHRLESLLIAANLKMMHLDHCNQNDVLPISKVLEAITTKKCQETFDSESLETLGDSFLKYAVSQQLFKTCQDQPEGVLTSKKEKIISNAALCEFGCYRKLPGFIRDESFDPERWIIPDDRSGSALSEEILFNTRKIYIRETRKMESETVADVVEALIGAFLSICGETSALLFMDWLGIKVDFHVTPYERHFQIHAENFVNVRHLESLLNYSFRDPSLLVEALIHGSYMLPEIPRCNYQRLEFLGDSVLDYLITKHFYCKYPGLSPELLTDMRLASVNDDCYARSAVKWELHKDIVHASQELNKQIVETINNFEKLSSESTFGSPRTLHTSSHMQDTNSPDMQQTTRTPCSSNSFGQHTATNTMQDSNQITRCNHICRTASLGQHTATHTMQWTHAGKQHMHTCSHAAHGHHAWDPLTRSKHAALNKPHTCRSLGSCCSKEKETHTCMTAGTFRQQTIRTCRNTCRPTCNSHSRQHLIRTHAGQQPAHTCSRSPRHHLSSSQDTRL